MQLSNERYDQIKWFVTIFLPALSTLIAGIFALYGLPNGEKVVGLITLVTAFLGTIMNISSSSYQGDGTLVVDTTSDPEKDIYSIVLADYPEVLAGKDTVVLKVVNDREKVA